MLKRVIAVVGPTASGKTELANRLAQYLSGEVLSCDSMQIYKELNIGTAKIRPEEMLAPHHGLNLVSFGEAYSVAAFADYSKEVIESCFARGVTPVACGGSGLYVRAALDEMDFKEGEQLNNEFRDAMQIYADEHGKEALYQLLLSQDPKAAEHVHPNNVKRVIRALEMLDKGVKYSDQVKGFKTQTSRFPTTYIGLSLSRDELYRRINQRVIDMIEAGLVEEVEQLFHLKLKETLTAAQAIGYKEVIDYLENKMSLDEAIAEIQKNSRRFAKRQLTWFKSDNRISWIEVDELNSDEVLEEALNKLGDVDEQKS